MALLECPMCDFTAHPSDDYILQLHFEQIHTEDSPFVVHDDTESGLPALPPRPSSKRRHGSETPTADEEESTVVCPKPDCGEAILLSDYNDHLDFHTAESLSFDETTGEYHSHHSSATMHSSAVAPPPLPGRSKHTNSECASSIVSSASRKSGEGHGRKVKKHRPRERRGTNSSEKSIISRSIASFSPFTRSDKNVQPPNKNARLGKSELGPYAYEERMPQWLYGQLEKGPKITSINRIGRDGRLIKQEQVQNETPGLIPVLAQLSALDHSVKEAYYCHPSTLHIGKTPNEGGFCGYRNIQMLLSYIQGAKAQGHEEFPGRTPGILRLQDLIETAWDQGINHIGRLQTGGIRGTRKYIGTPEAQAFCLSSQINCAVEQFNDNEERDVKAHGTLLTAIERYFVQAAVSDDSNVYKTLLPPIYLQQPGHSLTIVGFERRRDNSCNLVVFDPMYSTSPAMHKLLGRKNIKNARPEVLYAYRRGIGQLKKHAAFEILMLTATPPLFPAWDVLRQFPDCRYVYAFFRSRTLGFDVYPEDYFVRNFPWQDYGGLWICDDARFARAESVKPLIAQHLRRITGEGASSRSSYSDSSISPFTNDFFHHLPTEDVLMHIGGRTRLSSFVSSLDGSPNSLTNPAQIGSSGPICNMGSLSTTLPQPSDVKPKLSLLTDIGRRYPGYPSPMSPTQAAKATFPSPAWETASDAVTPRVFSPEMRVHSPMSVGSSDMYRPSHRYKSQGLEQYASQINLIDSVLATNSRYDSPQPSRSGSISSRSTQSPLSPTSPSRCTSPRAAMLRNMVNKHALHGLSHQPMSALPQGLE
ncbi:hypothetical protein ACN47E_003415 [Coniothyrium glycines]